jgi:hypothetical protein
VAHYGIVTTADDEALLRRAEKALTEIKIAGGLSDRHASVLAALRLRLTGDPGTSLEDMLEAAGDLGGPKLDQLMEEPPPAKPARSLDDVLSEQPRKKPSLDDLLGGG